MLNVKGRDGPSAPPWSVVASTHNVFGSRASLHVLTNFVLWLLLAIFSFRAAHLMAAAVSLFWRAAAGALSARCPAQSDFCSRAACRDAAVLFYVLFRTLSVDWCTRREGVHRRVADVLDGSDPEGVLGLTPAAPPAT